MCCDSPSPPPPPDYTGAAIATAAGNREAAQVAAKANRVSEITPLGRQDFYSGAEGFTDSRGNVISDPDRWLRVVSLTPEGQALFDTQQRISSSLGGIAESGLSYVKSELSNPSINQSGLPQRTLNAGQTGQDALLARIEPQFQRQEADMRNRLANQGLVEGGEAYARAMDEINRARNDARLQAALQGINIGDAARQSAIQEQAYFADRPLNVVNALRSGAQVTMPQFQQYGQQQTVAGPDLLRAAQAQYQGELGAYNAAQQANSNMMGGLFSLGGAVLGSPWAGTALGFASPGLARPVP